MSVDRKGSGESENTNDGAPVDCTYSPSTTGDPSAATSGAALVASSPTTIWPMLG